MLVECISFDLIIYLAYFGQLFSIAVSKYINMYSLYIAQFHQVAHKLFHCIKLSRNIHVTNWLGSMYISYIHKNYMTLSVYTKGGTVASLRYIYYIYIFLFFYSLVCCLLSVCITLQDYCSRSSYYCPTNWIMCIFRIFFYFSFFNSLRKPTTFNVTPVNVLWGFVLLTKHTSHSHTPKLTFNNTYTIHRNKCYNFNSKYLMAF